ncbi:MAG: beta-eliminating lyase-related protein [Pseudomonadota bacterium]
MDFSSDTSAAAHPRVLETMAEVNSGMEGSYGNDSFTARARKLLEDTFETDDFDLWMCASGTASNSLALSCFCPPTGSILCHEEAHIERDERGAPEFFTGGGKLALLGGHGAIIDEAELREALASIDRSFVHETPPHVLSLTNLTECGTAYPVETVQHYAALAHEADLSVHLDGARFGNALAGTDASPADMSWRAGVDFLAFGLTKTGAIGCEIIMLFGDARTKFAELQARAKRSGHMPPKMRFLAAQAIALLEDGLWLSLAHHANSMATQLANAVCSVPGVSLAYPVHGNEVFAVLPPKMAKALIDAGAKFYPWPGGSHRFVCNWNTSQDEIDTLCKFIASI